MQLRGYWLLIDTYCHHDYLEFKRDFKLISAVHLLAPVSAQHYSTNALNHFYHVSALLSIVIGIDLSVRHTVVKSQQKPTYDDVVFNKQ